MFEGLKNFVNSKFEPKEEDFVKSGYLTPEQFVKGGDKLTQVGWTWKKPSDPKKNHPSLQNSEKQYLEVSGRSEKRIKDIMREDVKMVKVEGTDFEMPALTQEDLKKQQENDDDDNIIACRQYTISITYDSYYHVPRLWLTGNDEDGNPLSSKQIFQDITSEHENETVTFEEHPHLKEKQVTIHPCKHGERLKAFVQEAKERGVNYDAESALLIFLQFMPSIMPTIELECQIDIPLGN